MKEIRPEAFDRDVVHAAGLVVVDAYATWCGPCQFARDYLVQAEPAHPGVTFVSLDVDAGPQLVEMLSIKAVPTLILFKSGREIGRHLGIATVDEIAELIKQAR